MSTLFTSAAYAGKKFIPPGFEHFYEYKSTPVIFELPNNVTVSISVVANFDGIKTVEEPDKLKQALARSGVAEEYIEAVYQSVADSSVFGPVLFTYYYSSQRAKVEVPASYLSGNILSIGFTQLGEDRRAIISTNRLFTNHYKNDSNATLSNNTTIGFGRAHVHAEASAYASDNANNDVELEEFSYTYDLEGRSLKVFETQRGDIAENSTSGFDFTRNDEALGVTYFSNDNLLIKQTGSSKKLYFDMKAKGIIEVRRGEKIIYTDSVSKGQHNVSYRDLPRGNYDVTIVLKPTGFPEESIRKIIHNNNSETSLRGYDYTMTAMQSSREWDNKEHKQSYFDLGMTYSLLSDRLLIGGNSQFNGNSVSAGIGAKYSDSDFALGAYINHFRDGYLFNSSLQFDNLRFDYQMLQTGSSDTLSRIRYGNNDYLQASASYSSAIYSGTLSIFANRYIEKSRTPGSALSNFNLSARYNQQLFENVFFDVGYRYQKSFMGSSLDEHVFSLGIRINLNDSLSFFSGIDYSERSQVRTNSSLRYSPEQFEVNGVKLSGGADVSQYIDRTGSRVAYGLKGNAHNNKFNANIYANGTSQDYHSFSADIESTAIITSDSVYASRQKAPSYLAVRNDNFNAKKRYDDLGLIKVRKNGLNDSSKIIKGDYTLVGLDSYNEYGFKLDTELSGYSHRQVEQSDMFSYPGTIKELVTTFDQIVSVLTFFEDFNNQPINNVDCQGCTSITKVGDGVYNVSVQKGKRFQLSANEQICALHESYLDNRYGKSQCFPQIEEDETGLQAVIKGLGNKDERIYYLGSFDSNVIERYKSSMSDMEIIQILFNGNDHYFVKLMSLQEGAASNNKQVILELQNYALSNSDSDKLTQNR
ncbi:TcfC E-set like domain-containing protein [Vibrio sp. SCSIO 43137]|uniref:TcfC E-set like domain-containing protein n=1 Tax=Vibrio sp. SCSIO 43137 TaxID=3021011 RepID=UPI00230776BB|nr:TcfC E-set like domain-containing protein [Vibrio sp. SCSIO 43137]WCE32217.1 TcfC E-set like domain-containing protein [Vibrio sp. SCSIO 43137]